MYVLLDLKILDADAVPKIVKSWWKINIMCVVYSTQNAMLIKLY